MAELPVLREPVQFHLALTVSDLDRSVAFYSALFGLEPTKCHADYAKFDLDEPPCVVSLFPGKVTAGGPLNHVGLRLPDSRGLVAVQSRLERAGHTTLRQDGVECCYAFQTKFWATDPDGTRWEVYTVHADLAHRGDHHPVKLPISAQPSE